MFAQTVQVQLTPLAGREELTLQSSIAWLRFTGTHPRDLDVYSGYGISIPICRIRAWEHRDIELPDATDQLTVIWGDDATGVYANAIVSFLVTQGTMETTGGQAQSVALYRSQGEPELWASMGTGVLTRDNVGMVSLAFTDPNSGSGLTPWNGIPATLDTFFCGFQRSARDYTTNTAFGGASSIVMATVWLNAALSYLRLLEVQAAVIESTAAAEIWLTLVRINTQPTGGAAHTVVPYDDSATSGAECRRIPSGGAAVSSEALGTQVYRLGITGAVPTVNPASPVAFQSLYQPAESYEQRPYCTQNEGFAILADVNVATTVRMAFSMKWTEGGI